MIDIPYDTCQNYSLGAFLTLKKGENSFVSKQVISDVKNENCWVFNGDHTAFFLKGTVDGVEGEVNQDASTKGDNYASFTIGSKVDDEFEIVQCDNNKFKFYGSDCLIGNENPVGDYFSGATGKIKTKSGKAGYYVLYLNKQASPELWVTHKCDFYYVRGDEALSVGGDWGIHEELRLNPIDNADSFAFARVTLTKAGGIKIAHDDWDDNPKGWDFVEDSGARSAGQIVAASGDYNCNIWCKAAGTYDIYLKNEYILFISFAPAA